MTTLAGSHPAGWRESWARQENERRRRIHAAAQVAWQRRDAELVHCLEVAEGFQPTRDPESHAWLRLKRGEAVYWSGDAAMVETPHVPGLRAPDYRELGATLTATGTPAIAYPAVDIGRAAVTSQRAVFLGRARREWAYAKLAGLAHTTAGQTLMGVTNRQKVSGVVPRVDAVGEFRLHLALAMADAAGERGRLIQGLRDQVERHRQAAPSPPGAATPNQAPAGAWFSGVRLAAVAAGAVLVVCGLIGTALAASGADQEDPVSLPAAQESSTAPPPASPLRAAGSPTPSPSPSETAVEALPATEPAGSDQDQPPDRVSGGDCAAYLDSDRWCVAGIGDYDCEGGSGNGPHYAPEGVQLVDRDVDPFGLDRDGDGEACERTAAPAPAPAPPPPPPPANPGTDPRFDTCGAAKAAGYGPYHQGQDPEYGWYRDADGDGVVCE